MTFGQADSENVEILVCIRNVAIGNVESGTETVLGCLHQGHIWAMLGVEQRQLWSSAPLSILPVYAPDIGTTEQLSAPFSTLPIDIFLVYPRILTFPLSACLDTYLWLCFTLELPLPHSPCLDMSLLHSRSAYVPLDVTASPGYFFFCNTAKSKVVVQNLPLGYTELAAGGRTASSRTDQKNPHYFTSVISVPQCLQHERRCNWQLATTWPSIMTRLHIISWTKPLLTLPR